MKAFKLVIIVIVSFFFISFPATAQEDIIEVEKARLSKEKKTALNYL